MSPPRKQNRLLPCTLLVRVRGKAWYRQRKVLARVSLTRAAAQRALLPQHSFATLAFCCRPAFHVDSCQDFWFQFLRAKKQVLLFPSAALHTRPPPPLSLPFLPFPSLMRNGPLVPSSVRKDKEKRGGDREVKKITRELTLFSELLTVVQTVHVQL